MLVRQIETRLPLLGAIAVCTLHFASFDILSRPLVTDVRYYVYFSWLCSEGAVPHADFFGNKTQLAAMVGGLVYPVGELLGHPLVWLRLCFLGFAALAGVLLFEIFRRLTGNDVVAGFLGLLAYCAFPLLGILPAIGTLPKLLMAVFASVMGLCVLHRRWFWAGVASALAFMDWQVGALAGVGACAAALVGGSPRLRALLAVVAGGLVGLVPFVLYFAWHGALGVFLQQTVGASLFRGAASMSETTVADRWAHMRELAGHAGASAPPLFYIGLAGIAIALWWLWRRRRSDAHPMLLALVIHHVGVLAFNLIDFQLYGDFFSVLHSVAFFLGIAFCFAYELVAARLAEGRGPRIAAGVLLAAAVALARPGPLRPVEEIPWPGSMPGLTLRDQQEVAHDIEHELAGKRIVFFQNAEIAYLLRYRNPVPFIYWNQATYGYARQSEKESNGRTLVRLLREVDPDAFAARHGLVRDRLPGYASRTYRSHSGLLNVTLRVREPS